MKTHTNHQPGLQEVKYLPLPEVTRQEVRSGSADGIELIDNSCIWEPITILLVLSKLMQVN